MWDIFSRDCINEALCRIKLTTWMCRMNIKTTDSLSTWWPREASSSMICFMLIYWDPPRAMKPTIRADKTELTVSDSKLSANNAIFVFEWPCMPLTPETFVTQVSNARNRTLKRCVSMEKSWILWIVEWSYFITTRVNDPLKAYHYPAFVLSLWVSNCKLKLWVSDSGSLSLKYNKTIIYLLCHTKW